MASAMPGLVGQSSAFALVGAEETRKLYSILAFYLSTPCGKSEAGKVN